MSYVATKCCFEECYRDEENVLRCAECNREAENFVKITDLKDGEDNPWLSFR